MTYVLIATLVLGVAVGFLVAYRFRIADRQLDALGRAAEMMLREGYAERERMQAQINSLLNRIQAPEIAPFTEGEASFEKQHVSFDSDNEFWKQQEDLNG